MSGGLVSKPWLIGGDFNVAVSIDEYLGRALQNLNAMVKFADCISIYVLRCLELDLRPSLSYTGVSLMVYISYRICFISGLVLGLFLGPVCFVVYIYTLF